MTTTAPARFTGRHMMIILVAFFAVVIAVNLTMARMAIGTFGGTVVDNSYVASQQYNSWLAEARRERALGWQVAVTRDGSDHLLVGANDAAGRALPAPHITALVRHPLGRRPERMLAFVPASDGRLRSLASLGGGRWQVVITVESKGRRLRLARDMI